MVKKLIHTLIILIAFTGVLRAQVNLVPNPSFEEYIQCPNNYGQLYKCSDWINPTTASPDYFNSCSIPNDFQTPTNVFGNQTTLDGQAYAGLGLYLNTTIDFREYLQIKLLSKLAENKYYHIGFNVSLAGKKVNAITDDIGLYVSKIAPTKSNTKTIDVIPQIQSNVLIEDTVKWITVDGYYKAFGGEEYITIGNFQNDNETTLEPTNYPAGDYIYVYIDNVSVIEINEPIAKPYIQLYPSPATDVLNINLHNIGYDNKSLLVYDFMGQLVFTENINSDIYTLNTISLANGVYTIAVLDNKKYLVKEKFVVMH